MHPVVQKAKKQVNMWIGILTFGGIGAIVLYTTILIPSANLEMITYALVTTLIPTVAMVIFHEMKMGRRWKAADAYLRDSEESGLDISAEEALIAMLDFPVRIPMLGFGIWAVGGAFAALGAMIATGFRVLVVDYGTLYVSVISGAVLITIFQAADHRPGGGTDHPPLSRNPRS